jgi:hypothetical protein
VAESVEEGEIPADDAEAAAVAAAASPARSSPNRSPSRGPPQRQAPPNARPLRLSLCLAYGVRGGMPVSQWAKHMLGKTS